MTESRISPLSPSKLSSMSRIAIFLDCIFLDNPSSYFMKSPPVQYTDDEARELLEDFIAGEETAQG